MGRPSIWLTFAFALGLAALALAEDASGALAPLRERLAALSAQGELDPHAQAARAQAERALQGAEQSADPAERARATRLCEAALTLAERLEALARERELLRMVRERKAGLGTRREAAREALARERARLVELGGEKAP